MLQHLKEVIEKIIKPRKLAYEQTFQGVYAAEVLRDLENFCRANETCFDADPRIHAVLEGRREVWLRIQRYLNLTPEQLMALRVGQVQSMEQLRERQ